MGSVFGEKGTFEVPFEVPRCRLRSRIPDTVIHLIGPGPGPCASFSKAWPAGWPGHHIFACPIWPAGWPGHHVCGLPTMYLGSPPCILIKGIRYPGTQLERGFKKWNANGTRIRKMEREWNADWKNETRMERKWSADSKSGTQMERKWNANAKKDNIKRSHEIPPKDRYRIPRVFNRILDLGCLIMI